MRIAFIRCPVLAALATGTVAVLLATGCGSAARTSETTNVNSGSTLVLSTTTIPLATQATRHRWGEAFTARARVAVGKAGQGKATAVRCLASLTIVQSGHRTMTALCTAVADADCGEWFVYRKGARLVASLRKFQPLSVCRRKT
jgi:hypothetical protein